jgi:hypothetical protein
MNWTAFAGLAGLVAAAVLAGWMLLSANTTTSTAHRGYRRQSTQPALTRAGRHRAPAHRALTRLRPR